ncbi:hypothetical protein PAXRUDRAFT_770490 [Paxillus rubicundulus Ve08.2h10]|uniref:Uncharacterized protein n=1 Tax=Paxillus rubicundulus Ve08.2h10 TaxID=930991 RepID=A0A0D0DLE3_9AGAM|nr:hypothetical protein PAXRUDRAFT_770490 [Paxillus rubicundulus Ve08.2h10]
MAAHCACIAFLYNSMVIFKSIVAEGQQCAVAQKKCTQLPAPEIDSDNMDNDEENQEPGEDTLGAAQQTEDTSTAKTTEEKIWTSSEYWNMSIWSSMNSGQKPMQPRQHLQLRRNTWRGFLHMFCRLI